MILTQPIEFAILIDITQNTAVIHSRMEYLGKRKFYSKDKMRLHIMIVSLENPCSLHPEVEQQSSF